MELRDNSSESEVWIRFSSVHLIGALECYRRTNARVVPWTCSSTCCTAASTCSWLTQSDCSWKRSSIKWKYLLSILPSCTRGEHSCSAAVRKNCMEIKLVGGLLTSACCEHHDSISYHFDVACLTWRAKSWRSYR